jgi:hypothetical protein
VKQSIQAPVAGEVARRIQHRREPADSPVASPEDVSLRIATIIAASPGDPLVKNLVAEAVRTACIEYCSWCQRRGGQNGRLCTLSGIHYCRVLAAHISGKISDTHLVAVQITLESHAPIPEKLLSLEPWQALKAANTTKSR